MINPIQINDLDIKSFLKIVFAIQLAMLGVIGLDAIGLHIPIIRQFIGFIYLTFIPGIIILRILKLHKLGDIETLLYTVGLSIVTLMFTGLFMNIIYPFFGVSGPISLVPLIITISVVVLILCILGYIRDKNYANPSFIDVDDIVSPPVLFLCFIPFMAVLGSYLMNFYHTNILLMLMIIVTAVVVLLIAFDRFIPKKIYPFAAVMIAIALLLHVSLLSMDLIGWDIHSEYYIHKLVEINSYWNPHIKSNSNSMLSVVMLPVIYTTILKLDYIWVSKCVYTIIFSLVSLGLYDIYKKQTNEKVAFFSVFFFISLSRFFGLMPGLPRQEIAELFYTLLILLMINRDMDIINRRLLFIIFGIGIIVSHYALAYIYIIFSFLAIIILYIMKYKSKTLTIGSIAIFVVMSFVWYTSTSYSSPFDTVVHLGEHIFQNIYVDFLNPDAREGAKFLLKKTINPLSLIHKSLHVLSQIFVFVGIIGCVLKYKKTIFFPEFFSFSIVNFAIWGVVLVIPAFNAGFNFSRLYHLTLFFLAPFCILGGRYIFELIFTFSSFLHGILSKKNKKTTLGENALNIKVLTTKHHDVCINFHFNHVHDSFKWVSIFLVLFLLTNTGFLSEIYGEHPQSIALSFHHMRTTEDRVAPSDVSYTYEQDIFGATWLSRSRGQKNAKVYADFIATKQILVSYGSIPTITQAHLIYKTMSCVPKGSYVYLSYTNVVNGIIIAHAPELLNELDTFDTKKIAPYLNKVNKIYTNGGNEIYYNERAL